MADNVTELLIKLRTQIEGGASGPELLKQLEAAQKAATEASKQGADAAKKQAEAEAALAESTKRHTEAAKELQQAQVQEVKGTNEVLTEQARLEKAVSATAASKARLKDAARALAFEYPVLGRAFGFFLNPMTGAIVTAVGLFAALKGALRDFEEALEDPASTTRWNTWAETQRDAIAQVRTELDQLKREIAAYNPPADDPDRVYSNRVSELTRADAADQRVLDSLVSTGRMGKEDAERRTKQRKDRLAADLFTAKEERAANLSIQRNLAQSAVEEQARVVAGTLDPKAATDRLAELKAQRKAELANVEKAEAVLGSFEQRVKKSIAGPIFADKLDAPFLEKRDTSAGRAAALADEIARLQGDIDNTTGAFGEGVVAREELDRRVQRFKDLDRRGKDAALEIPLEREMRDRERSADEFEAANKPATESQKRLLEKAAAVEAARQFGVGTTIQLSAQEMNQARALAREFVALFAEEVRKHGKEIEQAFRHNSERMRNALQ